MDEQCNYSIGVVWLNAGAEKPLNQVRDSCIQESPRNLSVKPGRSKQVIFFTKSILRSWCEKKWVGAIKQLLYDLDEQHQFQAMLGNHQRRM